MPKMLAQTTGKFELHEGYTREMISHDRPYLVSNHPLFQQRAAAGQVTIHATDLPDNATDAGWAKTHAEAPDDLELAIASYRAELDGPEKAQAKADKKAAKSAAAATPPAQ